MNKNKAAALLGRLGGLKTSESHDKSHYSAMAKKSWEKRRKVLGSVTVEDIQNPVTLKTVQEKLEKIDKQN